MKRSLNLMSPVARRKALVRASLAVWLRIYLLAVMLFAVDWGVCWWDARNAVLKRESFESQYAPIKRVKAETRIALEKIEQVEEQERVAIALATPRSALSLLGSVSQAATRSHGMVYLEQFDFRDTGDSTTSRMSASSLNLRGVGRTDAAVTSFVDGLREKGPFSKVQLVSSVSKQVEDQMVREFQVECAFSK